MNKNYIVIHCPNNEAHVTPKILLFADENTRGPVYVQCRDWMCRKISRSQGWYEVKFNGTGGYTVRKIPARYHFENTKVPVAILED
jgi:hypothetical protein